MNYYHRYSGDYIKKTLELDMIEDGAYTRLLDWMYANERPVRHEKRYTVTRCQSAAERSAVDSVLEQFFVRQDDVWTHERTAEVIEEARPRIEAARTNGKKGGRPKGSTNKPKKEPAGFSDGNPDATQSESSPYPIHQEIPRSTTALEAGDPGDAAARVDLAAQTPTRAGAACRLMRQAGLGDTNPGHPDLLVLLAAGVSDEELRGAAVTAVERGKGFAYALGMLTRQRQEAAAKGATLHQGAMPAPAAQPVTTPTPPQDPDAARYLSAAPLTPEQIAANRERARALREKLGRARPAEEPTS